MSVHAHVPSQLDHTPNHPELLNVLMLQSDRNRTAGLNMHTVIRRYQPNDREDVERVFREGIEEHINPAFVYAMTRPVHITVSLLIFLGSYVSGGPSVLLALMCGGAWIGFMYFCCHEFYASYVRARLNTDMKDIAGYYLSNPDNCYWVAEAEINGRSQIMGMVAVEGKNADGKKYGDLYRMIVSSSCRRTGLGLRLAKTAEDFCRERGFSKIKLMTTSTQRAAVALYLKLGFTFIPVKMGFDFRLWMSWMIRITFLSMEKSL